MPEAVKICTLINRPEASDETGLRDQIEAVTRLRRSPNRSYWPSSEAASGGCQFKFRQHINWYLRTADMMAARAVPEGKQL